MNIKKWEGDFSIVKQENFHVRYRISSNRINVNRIRRCGRNSQVTEKCRGALDRITEAHAESETYQCVGCPAKPYSEKR